MNFLKNLFKKSAPISNFEPINIDTSTKDELSSNEFIFTLLRPNVNEIELCNISEAIGLWVVPDTNDVLVYRRGTHSGQGFIGAVPEKYAILIIQHKSIEGDIYTEIKQVFGNNLSVYCRLIPLEETLNKVNQEKETIKALLVKPFNPKADIQFKIYDSETTITKRTKFKLRFKSLDEYVNDIDNLSFQIVSEDENHSFEISSDRGNIIKVIRSNNSGYNCNVKITNIDHSYIVFAITPIKI